MNIDSYGYKVKTEGGAFWLYAEFKDSTENWGLQWHLENEEDNPYSPAYINPKTICRCSGVKDSDGRLIYENDYISTFRTYDGSPIYEKSLIVYDKMQWFYAVDNHKYPLVTLANHGDGINIYVVGNKFDTEEQK